MARRQDVEGRLCAASLWEQLRTQQQIEQERFVKTTIKMAESQKKAGKKLVRFSPKQHAKEFELIAAVFAERYLFDAFEDETWPDKVLDAVRAFVTGGLKRRGVTFSPDGRAIAIPLTTAFDFERVRIRAFQISVEEMRAVSASYILAEEENDALNQIEIKAWEAGAIDRFYKGVKVARVTLEVNPLTGKVRRPPTPWEFGDFISSEVLFSNEPFSLGGVSVRVG